MSISPVPVRAWEFGLARRVRASRPASICSLSTLRLNMVLTRGVHPAFRDGVHIYRQPPSGQSRVYRATQLRTDGVHCRVSAGTGPVVLKKVPVMGATFASPWTNFMCSSFFPHPLLVGMLKVSAHVSAYRITAGFSPIF